MKLLDEITKDFDQINQRFIQSRRKFLILNYLKKLSRSQNEKYQKKKAKKIIFGFCRSQMISEVTIFESE